MKNGNARKIYLIVDKDKAERLVKLYPELKRRSVYRLAFEKGIEIMLEEKEEKQNEKKASK